MAETRMPKYGHVHLFLAITWPNINNFEQNQHHLIHTIKLHVFSIYNSICVKIADLCPKICHIPIRVFA